MDKDKIFVPPIKIQGIKTKLVPVIKESVVLSPDTIWVEPFMGSGVVGFNIAPRKAIFSDTNPYTIEFYNQIKSGNINSYKVRDFLEKEGKKLAEKDDEYYYEVRERFNKEHNILDFLFLNRSCFNGMIRFNRSGEFNVPYGHKPKRFSKAYITKITNQVKYIENKVKECDWNFVCQSFEETIKDCNGKEFIYCDPPYIGRNVDYYDSWDEKNELKLNKLLLETDAKFMLSTWDYNQYRRNEYIDKIWHNCQKINIEHFYHLGAKEKNRNAMIEALITNYNTSEIENELIFINQKIKLSAFA